MREAQSSAQRKNFKKGYGAVWQYAEPLSTAKKYMTHGAAAYDVRRKEKLDPVELPEEREAPARIHRVRATPHVSPFAVIGMAVTAFLAMLVVFGYVRLYEADSAVSELEDQLFQLQTEQAEAREQLRKQD